MKWSNSSFNTFDTNLLEHSFFAPFKCLLHHLVIVMMQHNQVGVSNYIYVLHDALPIHLVILFFSFLTFTSPGLLHNLRVGGGPSWTHDSRKVFT